MHTHFESQDTRELRAASRAVRESVCVSVGLVGPQPSSLRKMRVPVTAFKQRTIWCSSATPVDSQVLDGVEQVHHSAPLPGNKAIEPPMERPSTPLPREESQNASSSTVEGTRQSVRARLRVCTR